MSNTVFDIAIIGAGAAGCAAAYKLANENKSIKIIMFDIGAAFSKRRSQLCGALGSFPFSDGKLWMNDTKKIEDLCGKRKAAKAVKEINDLFGKVSDLKIIKDKKINSSLEKKINKQDYNIIYNNYIQFNPSNIHSLSKIISSSLDKNDNIYCSFNNEVNDIEKYKNLFILNSDDGTFKAKKVLISVGRSGWRWSSKIFKKFGLIENNDYSKFGIKAEMSVNSLKEFNKSHCSLIGKDIEIGPFNWMGTVIPEDHVDMALSSFRSNEDRWISDKVSFDIIGNRYFKDNGYEQSDRIANLTFILTNERISKEKISALLNGKSKISIMKEYDWLKTAISQVSNFIPELITKAYFHVPTVITLPPQINIGSNLETEVEGLYVAGESSGIQGIYAASIMGAIAADNMI